MAAGVELRAILMGPRHVLLLLLGFAAAGVTGAGCASSAGEEPGNDDQAAAELRKKNPTFYTCHIDADCVAVDRVGCCHNGWLEAVNVTKVSAYERSFTCSHPAICPMYQVNDTRVADCNTATRKCEMVEPPPAPDAGTADTGASDGGCVQHVLCTRFSHFDTAACRCLTNPLCGGFAGLVCPAEYTQCIDNPNDGCDPNVGGADCPGVCVK